MVSDLNHFDPIHYSAEIGETCRTNPLIVLAEFVFHGCRVTFVKDIRCVDLHKCGPTPGTVVVIPLFARRTVLLPTQFRAVKCFAIVDTPIVLCRHGFRLERALIAAVLYLKG